MDKYLFKEIEKRLYNYKNLDMQIKAIELQIRKEKLLYEINHDETIGKDIERLENDKVSKEIEKEEIENAIECLDTRETEFFKLFYSSKDKNRMRFISTILYLDERHCYRIRNALVYKIADMLCMNLI